MSEDHTHTEQDQAIDRLYGSMSVEQPPASVDRKILDAAHSEIKSNVSESGGQQTIWFRSLAYAAVMVLAVGVIVEISLQPDVFPTEPQSVLDVEMIFDQPAVQPETLELEADFKSEQGVQSRQNQPRQKARIETQSSLKLKRMAPATAPAPSAASPMESSSMDRVASDRQLIMLRESEGVDSKPWRRNPEQWLAYSQQLLDQNKLDELLIELTELQQQHGDIELTEALQQWLEQTGSALENP